FNSGSLKDQILSSLAQKNLPTAKELYSNISKNKSISYQAVYKALNELESARVLEKNGREYSINNDWVDNSIKALNQIKTTYVNKTKKLKIDRETEKPQIFKFTSYSALCVSMAELLRDRALSNPADKGFICTLEYGWFPFKFKFGDFFTLMETVKNNPEAINIIRKNTPLGKWIQEQYKRINAICAPMGTKVDINEDLFINGEYIIEIRFSEESKKILEKYYNKLRNMEDVFREFALRKEPEMDITVTITKNSQLAEFLRAKLMDVYEKSIKIK
ncbi:MAG: hypothetical protein WC652_05320, partial [archaeon]